MKRPLKHTRPNAKAGPETGYQGVLLSFTETSKGRVGHPRNRQCRCTTQLYEWLMLDDLTSLLILLYLFPSSRLSVDLIFFGSTVAHYIQYLPTYLTKTDKTDTLPSSIRILPTITLEDTLNHALPLPPWGTATPSRRSKDHHHQLVSTNRLAWNLCQPRPHA
jgi:hypothetical protein